MDEYFTKSYHPSDGRSIYSVSNSESKILVSIYLSTDFGACVFFNKKFRNENI